MVNMDHTNPEFPGELPAEQAHVDLPLSEGQRALWFIQRLNPKYIGNNLVVVTRARISLDLQAAHRALQSLVNRHPALRTSIVTEQGEPFQRVYARQEVSFHTEDISGLDDVQVDERLADEVRRPIDLEKDPLFQATILSKSPSDYLIVIKIHHIVADMWSFAILFYEVNQFYRFEVTGEPAELKPPRYSYADFIKKQTDLISSPEGDAILEYWRRRLDDDLPALNLPSIGPANADYVGEGAAETILLSDGLPDQLRNLGKSCQTSLYMVMLAAFQVLLYRYTNQDQILTGFIKANRSREMARVFGYFVNPILINTVLPGEITFTNLLKKIQKDITQDFQNDSYPFPLLLEKLHLHHDNLHQTIPQVMFTWQKTTRLVDNQLLGSFAIQAEGGGMKMGLIPFETVSLPVRACPFDLTMYMAETEHAIGATLEYRTDLYDGGMIRRMLGHFRQLLESIVQNPDRPISTLSILPEDEKNQILGAWNDTIKSNHPESSIHELFEAQVEQTPDAVALIFGKEQVTYRELNERVNQLAHYLVRLGVKEDVVVGLCLERSPDEIACILAILKAGGAYLPLDPAYPPELSAYMLRDSQAKYLFTRHGLFDSLSTDEVIPIYLDENPPAVSAESIGNPSIPARPDQMAYVIYTSGSTGAPKGVMGLHRGAVNRFQWMWDTYPFVTGEIGCHKTSLSFVDSIWEIFGPLLKGIPLLILSAESAKDPHLLTQALAENRVSRIVLVPSLLRAILDECERSGETLPRLRFWVSSGEALLPLLAHRFYQFMPSGQLLNLYGCSEAAADTTCYEISKGPSLQIIPIGRPIDNTQVYICDPSLEPVPIGVIGEMYIGGKGLARGYINRLELTHKKYIRNPFNPEVSPLLYRTGDLARYRENGVIEYLGRSDNQVKLRGMRIELGEIESVLRTHPAVDQAVVILLESPDGEKFLQACIVSHDKDRAASLSQELRHFLRGKVPEYMVPASFTFLEEIPLTHSQKVDRKALASMVHRVEDTSQRFFTPPRNPIEIELTNIWADVLELPQVGVHDNFFDLGGHSLLATRLASRIERAFGAPVPLQNLFDHPTISGLAEYILAALQKAPKAPQPEIPIVSRGEPLPLGFSQERIWFIHQLDPSPAYHVPIAIRINGVLDPDVIQRSLQQVINRHEILRTTFQLIDGTPKQVIAPSYELKLKQIDLRYLPAEGREGELIYLLEDHMQEPFELAHGPLIRAILFRMGEAESVVALNLHHVICDAWSISILGREIASICEAFSKGLLPDLPPLPIQFGDFAAWQRRWYDGGKLEQEMDFWKKELEGISVLSLPTDYPRPAVQTYRGSFLIQEQDAGLVADLRMLCRQQGVTLFMTMLTAFNVLLFRYTGQEDIVLGLPVANRHWLDTENLVGPFVNTLLLRTYLNGNTDFSELLQKVRKTALQVYAHQDMPFEKLVVDLHPERDSSYTPLFQVMFNYTSIQYPSIRSAGIQWSPVFVNRHASQFDLTFTVSDVEDQVLVSLEYNADLFKESTISLFLAHFQSLLTQIIRNPDQSIGKLNFLLDEERQKILVEWNNTALPEMPQACIHALFEAQVESTPEATVLIFEGTRISYRELNEQANQIARYLRKLGVQDESLVGVCLERSPYLICALLGVMKAGGAYLPLSPTHPKERLAFMIADAQAGVILTRAGLRQVLPENSAKIVCVDSDQQLFSAESIENPGLPTKQDQLAYVIYTSGSTGTPKGILGLHKGAINRFQWMWNRYPFTPTDVCCHKTWINFVDSIWEIFGPLLKGIPAVIFSDEIVKDTRLFVQALAENHVTRIVLVPSLLSVILDTVQDAHQSLPDLGFWVSSGEAISLELVKRFYSQFPDACLLNLYGSSEASADSTFYEVPKSLVLASVPIGKPISNTQAYILDTNLQLAPVGNQGELFIGGAGLARGYLNHADWTAERFIANPFSPEISPRLYRTGDLARYLPDGNIEYLGRIGSQVKIRGMRVELEEVEMMLCKHPAVQDAVVWWIMDAADTKRLIAYFKPKDTQENNAQLAVPNFRQFLAKWLPEYMIPAQFVPIEHFPLTSSGKVNYRALPLPVSDSLEHKADIIQPHDQIERKMLNLWEEVLEQSPISIQDNFFDIGGHSLLAIQLFTRIEREFGQRVPIISIFRTPTIEGLAEVIRSGKVYDSPPVLIPMQQNGTRPPFFCIHGFGGGVTGYYDLAQLMGEDQPFIGVQAKGIDSQETPHSDVVEMASYYLAAIRAAQPKGPYYLGGYCYGGVVAFEIARQLESLGEEIALLAVFEGYAPIRAETRIYLKPRYILNFIKNVPYWLHDFRQISGNQKVARVTIALRFLGRSLFGVKNKSSWLVINDAVDNVDQIPEQYRALMEIHLNAMLQYTPHPIKSKLTLFRVRGLSLFRAFDPTMGWSRLTKSGVKIEFIDGAHFNITARPQVESLARRLKANIEEANRQ